MVIDICGSPEAIPWTVDIYKPYEEKLDALGVCVLGDFKVGKTFLINNLCNLNLASVESHHTKGLSFKRGKEPRNQVVWIDTAGPNCPYDVRRETAEERNQVETFLNELAYRLADVRIIVVSNCKFRDQQFISAIHQQIKEDNKPGKDLLIIVHNYTRIADPSILEAAFQNDVVKCFNIQEVTIPYRFQSGMKHLWVDRSDPYPVYHLFLGQHGTPAGNRFNEQTFNAIFDLCVDRLGYSIRHDFIEDTVQLANDPAARGKNDLGMLAEHFRCYKRVEYDPAKQAIVAVPDSGAAENHLPMSMPMAPEFTASATEQPYYTFSSEQANPASPMY
jgi:hypothetical protein